MTANGQWPSATATTPCWLLAADGRELANHREQNNELGVGCEPRTENRVRQTRQ
jgi:hypothetical protein